MKISTGIQGLDEMLKGGFIKGRNILLSGPCGSGKTTLAMQFLYNGVMMYGEPSLYVTLEESKDKIYEDMANFGFNLRAAENTGRFMVIGGPIASLKTYMDKFDANIKHIIKEIEEVVRQHNIKRVVIDSINLLTMLLKSNDERRKAIAALCNSLSALDCTTLLTSETEEGTMKLSRYGMEEFIVDGVIVLYLVRQGSRFVPGIVVRKMRGTSHDKQIRVYQITGQGIIVHPQETMFTNIR
jgi:KaiC/GvpD/RAD55 family RecA-like ATPase